MANRPTIPAGDIARRFNLPGWLRKILDLVRGVRIKAGPVDVLLEERPGGTAPGTGLDQPHRVEPPRMGGPRR